MNKQPFFLFRWWNGLMLQTRLFLAFTLLFVFCVLSLSLLLNNVIQMIRINQQTQAVFEQNQMAYRLNAEVAQYQLALQSYENSDTDRSLSLSEQALVTSREQIQKSLSQLSASLSEKEQAQLDQFANSSARLGEISDQVVEAVNAQEWDKVLDLDNQAQGAIEQMSQVVDYFQEKGQRKLDEANQEADALYSLSLITMLVVLPVFLILAVLTALVIYQQINRPLAQLADASQAVLEGKFQPQGLEKLTSRGDEIGAMARRFVQMASSVSERTSLLRQEANAIRAKIR